MNNLKKRQSGWASDGTKSYTARDSMTRDNDIDREDMGKSNKYDSKDMWRVDKV